MSNVCEVKPSIYSPDFEHDNCGIGAIVNIKGVKTHQVVENALKIVENLEHRAGKDAEGKTGDGVGILLQISHKFFSKAARSLGINIGGEREYGVGMFFSRRMSSSAIRLRRCSRLLPRRKVLNY